MSKKHMIFKTIFSRFFFVLASENDSKIDVFSLFFQKRRFCENALKHWLCAQKSRFELEKNKKKSPKNRFPNVLEKNIAKNLSKLNFYPHLDLPKPLKTAPSCKNSLKKNPPKKKTLKRAMELRSPHRKSGFLGPSRTIQLPFQ